MKGFFRGGKVKIPPGMPPDGYPEGYVPQTEWEAAYLGKEWTGVVSNHKRPSLNRPGINEQPGPDVPKQSGIRLR